MKLSRPSRSEDTGDRPPAGTRACQEGRRKVRAIPHIAPAEAAGEEQLVSDIGRALK